MKLNAFLKPSLRKGFILPAVIVVLTLGLILQFASQAQAANGVQKSINFQGKVVNANGTNVTDGVYDFVVKIYDGAGNSASTLFTESWTAAALFSSTMSSAPTTSSDTLTYSSNTNESTLKVGQILWNVTKKEAISITAVNTGTNVLGISRPIQNWANGDTITNGIYVKDGVFRVAINSLNQDLSGVNFGSDSIHVGVNFNADGEMRPRMQLRANAYAFNAEKVNGLTVTNTSDAAFSGATALKINDGSTIIFGGNFTTSGSNALTLTTTGTTALTLPAGTDTLVSRTSNDTLTNKTIGNTGLLFENNESISNATNGAITFGRNDAGIVTLTAADNDATAAMTILPGGAAAMILGGSSMTALTVTTDGTGTAEVALPAGSIDSTEVLDATLLPADLAGSGLSDEFCLTYEGTGTTFEWQNCNNGSTTLQSAYTTGNSIETTGNTAIVITETTTGAYSGDLLQLTANQAAGGSFSGDGLQITMDAVDANGFTGNGLRIEVDASQNTGNMILAEDDAGADLFVLSETGVVTLAGAQTADITSVVTTGLGAALTMKPGLSTGGSSNGGAITISAGDGSGTTSVTGGALTLTAGSATGGSGTRNGGSVTINAGDGATSDGAISLGTANTTGITFGNGTNNTTFAFAGSGAFTVAGNADIAGTLTAGTSDAFVVNATGNITTTGTTGFSMTGAGSGITFQNSETLKNSTDGQFLFGRNDAGIVTLTAADNDATAALTILPGGAAAMIIGGASMTGLTVTTDGTGTAEVALPTGSIDSTEILDATLLPADFPATGLTDEFCLTYEGTGTTFEWQTCSTATSLQNAYTAGNSIETSGNTAMVLTETTTGSYTGDLLQLTVNQAASGTFSGDALQITMDGNDANAFSGNGLRIEVDASQNTGNLILAEDDGGLDLFVLSEAGVVTLAGAQTSDITSVVTSGLGAALTLKPGLSTGGSSNGGAVTISAGDASGTTSVTGGALSLTAGSATGGSGTRLGGSITINAGDGPAAVGNDGTISIGTANTSGMTLGNTTNNTTFAFAGTGAFTVGGNVDIAGTLTSGTSDAFQVNATGGITTTSTTGLTFSGAGSGITFQNSETLKNSTDGQFLFGRNDAGIVTITAADNDATAALTILPGGAAGLTLGGASMTGLTVTTDGTGTAEVALPAGSIDSTEFLDASLLPADIQITGSATDENCLTYEGTGTQFEWQSCGSALWNTIGNPSGNLSLTMSTNTTAMNWATGTSTNNLYSLTTDASANGTGALFNLQTGASSTVLPLRVRAGATESLMVNAGGNVGIGTTLPTAKLHTAQTLTDTSGFLSMGLNVLTVNPGSASTGTFISLWNRVLNSSAFTVTEIDGLYNEAVHQGSALLGTAIGTTSNIKVTSTGNVTDSYGIYLNTQLTGSGTIGTNTGLFVNEPTKVTGGITNQTGIKIGLSDMATHNTQLLIGDTAPSGNWGIYNASTYANYIAGNIGIGTTNSATKLHVANSGAVAVGKAIALFDQYEDQDILTASASGVPRFAIRNNGTLVAGSDVQYALANGLVLPNTMAHFSGNVNSYAQVNAQNRSSGTSASTDFIATADNGNDTTNYIDLGVNSSTYNDVAFTISGANDGYLYNNGGNLGIGTQTTNTAIKFHTGGTLAANERMRIDGNGNVGIGITNPTTKLFVSSGNTSGITSVFNTDYLTGSTFATLALRRGILSNGFGTGMAFQMQDALGNSTEYGYIGSEIGDNTDGSEDGDLLFGVTRAGSTRSEIMRLNGVTGNVGMGIANYGFGRLSVGSVNASTNTAVDVQSLWAGTTGTAANGLGGNLRFLIETNNVSGTSYFTGGLVSATAIDVTDGSFDGALTFSTTLNNTVGEKMRIDNNGNVGIGTTNPTRPFQLAGTAPASSNGAIAYLSGGLSSAGNNQLGLYSDVNVNVTGASSSTYVGLQGSLSSSETGTDLQNASIIGLRGTVYFDGVAGTWGEAKGGDYTVQLAAAGTITNAYGLMVNNASNTGGTITNLYGQVIAGQTTGTNAVGLAIGEATGTKNTNLLIGTTTAPVGSWSIYNSSTDANYIAGNVGIGTSTPTDKLAVLGNVQIGVQADATSSSYSILNSAAGTFGSQTARDSVTGSVVYRGKLFVAVSEVNAAGVYRYDGGTTWTLVTNATVGKAVTGDTAIADNFVMTVWNDTLYIGSQTGNAASPTGSLGALYSSTTADTTADSFAIVNSARGTFGMSDTTVDGVSDLTVWNGKLYIGTLDADLAEVGRYDGGTTFTQITPADGRLGAVTTATVDGVVFAVHSGRLWAGARTSYAGTANGARVAVYSGEATTWADTTTVAGTIGVAPEANVDDITGLTVWNGTLYAATGEANAANIYQYEGNLIQVGTTAANWKKINNATGKVVALDSINIDAITLRSYNGRLYAGTQTASAEDTGALYEYSGVSGTWTLIGTRGTFGSQTGVNAITSMVEMNGTLYIGTDDGTTNNIGSMYTWSKTMGNSYALKFDSGNQNYGAMSFVDSHQALDGTGHQGSFLFSNNIALTSGAFDYAEDYPTYDTTLEAGDVVSIDPKYPEFVTKATKNSSYVGIVSENPGFRLSQSADKMKGEKWLPIALVGRVPAKVSGENGVIKSGDYLTVSSKTGALVKTTKAGVVLGQAMEDYTTEGIGKILVYVNTSSFNGVKTASGLDIVSLGDYKEGLSIGTTPLQSRRILAQLVTARPSLEDGVDLSEIFTDRIVAGLEVITPRIIADEIYAKVIHADRIEGLEFIESGIKNQESRISLLEGLLASQSATTAVLSVTDEGKIAGSSGTISPTPTIAASPIASQSASEILAANLTKLLNESDSADAKNFDIRTLAVNGLSVDSATVSANLRVRGNGIVEGIFNVIDTLTAGNLVVNGLATFMGDVLFKEAVTFEKTPTFSSDTAGYSLLTRGAKTATVTFEKEYSEEPIVTATLVTTLLTDENYKKLVDANYCTEKDGKDACQEKLDLKLLSESPSYIVTNRSKKGFTILLPKEAEIDYTFSWTAFATKKVSTASDSNLDKKAEELLKDLFGG